MATITVEQVVRETIGILGDIRVPASMTSEIAIPISRAISNLNACCDAWAREAAEAQQEITGDDIQLEIEPAEEEADHAD